MKRQPLLLLLLLLLLRPCSLLLPFHPNSTGTLCFAKRQYIYIYDIV